MSDEKGLLQAVCEAPDDDGPRLVYADWCEDNGQPERAEFIRSQIRRDGNGLQIRVGGSAAILVKGKIDL